MHISLLACSFATVVILCLFSHVIVCVCVAESCSQMTLLLWFLVACFSADFAVLFWSLIGRRGSEARVLDAVRVVSASPCASIGVLCISRFNLQWQSRHPVSSHPQTRFLFVVVGLPQSVVMVVLMVVFWLPFAQLLRHLSRDGLHR